ncbi:MAG TPA: hypothetical protein VFF69_15770 [Phycisphaerales bacterium]|nr:hypothetical protein [Phycisphaerales bacterium]
MAEQSEHITAPTPKPRSTICPYCGARTRNLSRCETCRGLFDPLSRQATQNAMGPWSIRDDARPHRPGCSYETLVRMVERGQVGPDTVLRGPSTLQFWTVARWCPGVAHLLGACHSCGYRVEPTDPACPRCGATFRAPADRQSLGLGEVRFVPGRGIDQAGGVEAGPPGLSAQPSDPAAPGGAAPSDDPVAAARTGRLARELAAARRWARIWLVAFVALALLVAAALVLPALDLGVGPVGAWLRGRSAAEPEARAPGPGAEIPAIQPEQPVVAPKDALDLPDAGPRPETGDGPVETPGESGTRVGPEGEGGAQDASAPPHIDPAIERLRRLR